MNQEVKLRRAGGSIAATLPKDMADRLSLSAGDTVIAIETESGILLTPSSEAEVVTAMIALASGTLDDLDLSEWARAHRERR